MSNGSIGSILLAGIGITVLVGGFVFFRRFPKALVATWTFVLFFVPIWIGVNFKGSYSAITIITILAIASLIGHRTRLSIVDIILLAFTTLLVSSWMLGWVTLGHLLIVLLSWMVPYVAGRLIVTTVSPDWIYSALAVCAVIAAVLGIVEFLIGTNFFALIKSSNAFYATWGPPQYRDGLLRVEGAWGHSIAFGASLAMCSVFVLVTRWPLWLRSASLLTIMVAVCLTFSRIGLIGLPLTLLAAVVLLGRRFSSRTRISVATLVLIGGAASLPLMNSVFTGAGEEASGSAGYRADLISLLHEVAPIGISPIWDVLPNGTSYYGSFGSIDSELILTALRFGLLPFLLLGTALVCCLVSVLRGRATPSAIAVIGQIPAFATVALITQYADLVWFVAGLAVATYPSQPRPVTAQSRAVTLGLTREEQPWLS